MVNLSPPVGCFDKPTIVFLKKLRYLHKQAKTVGAKAIGFPLARWTSIGNKKLFTK